jgi:hypothetical protein
MKTSSVTDSVLTGTPWDFRAPVMVKNSRDDVGAALAKS